MGRIMKLGMERLERRNLEVRLDCPNCGSARIIMSGGNGDGHLAGKECPKCGIEIVLDGVSITVIDDSDAMNAAMAEVQNKDAPDTIV